MTISKILSLTNIYHVFVFLISLLPLTQLITLCYVIVSLVGSAYLLFLSSGSPHTCRLALLPLQFNLIFLPHPLSLLVFHKAQFSVPLFSMFTLHLSVHHLTPTLCQQHATFYILHPKNFSLAISDLHSTVSIISSWMSSNYLTLNPSKTEFIVSSLP